MVTPGQPSTRVLGASVLYEYTKTPDPAWQRTLDTLFPPIPGSTRLMIDWFPGVELTDRVTGRPYWEPIERWVIYQVCDRTSQVPTPILHWMQQQLREVGRLKDTDPIVLDRASVDRNTWRYWQRTGHYAKPCWVLQGSQGGHPRVYDEVEEAVSRTHGGLGRAPHYGELPYCEPDARTWARLKQRERLGDAKALHLLLEDAPAALDAEERAQAIKAADVVWHWLAEDAVRTVDSFSWMDRAALKEKAPVGLSRSASTNPYAPRDVDEAHEHFLMTA